MAQFFVPHGFSRQGPLREITCGLRTWKGTVFKTPRNAFPRLLVAVQGIIFIVKEVVGK